MFKDQETKTQSTRCQNFQTCVFLPLSLVATIGDTKPGDTAAARGRGPARAQGRGSPGGGGGARLNDRFMT